MPERLLWWVFLYPFSRVFVISAHWISQSSRYALCRKRDATTLSHMQTFGSFVTTIFDSFQVRVRYRWRIRDRVHGNAAFLGFFHIHSFTGLPQVSLQIGTYLASAVDNRLLFGCKRFPSLKAHTTASKSHLIAQSMNRITPL
ncbi:MAG: hypothetical protein ACI90E_000950 [Yoonia sp.]